MNLPKNVKKVIFYANHIPKLLIAYFCCLSLGGNIDYLDLLQNLD